ncbi:MAG: phosphodiester glycosidase family protein [Chloroflexota bacterium]
MFARDGYWVIEAHPRNLRPYQPGRFQTVGEHAREVDGLVAAVNVGFYYWSPRLARPLPASALVLPDRTLPLAKRVPSHNWPVRPAICSAKGQAWFERFAEVDQALADRLDWAAGGGPMLLEGGEVVWRKYMDAEKYLGLGQSISRARTAIGLKADNTALLVVARSLSLDQLAAVLQAEGAVDAMYCDGGRSSGLWYRGLDIMTSGDVPAIMGVMREREAR